MKKIAIIGAGISGLALGWYLKKRYQDLELTIIEKADRTGGWIQTLNKDGFLFEQGPRSCRPKGTGIEVLRLIEELGLQQEVILASPDAHKRYLYIDNELQQVPNSFFSMLTSPLMQGVPSAIWKDLFAKPQTADDESIYEFISRRFSPKIAERFIDPLTSGIYAGNIQELSLKSCFPLLHECEQKHGSVVRGMFLRKSDKIANESNFIKRLRKESIYSFKGGMQTLTDALTSHLRENILLSTEIDALTEKNSGVEFQLSTGKRLFADHVFSTIPAHQLAKLFPSSAFAKKLQELRSTSVGVVNIGFKQNVLDRKGFGYLIPKKEGENILGMVWDSCIFPQQNGEVDNTRLTVMIGGANNPLFHQLTQDDLIKTALDSISKHLRINSLPTSIHLNLAHQAIPQYTLGHSKRVEELEKLAPPYLTFTGSSYRGVSVNDCVSQAYHIGPPECLK